MSKDNSIEKDNSIKKISYLLILQLLDCLILQRNDPFIHFLVGRKKSLGLQHIHVIPFIVTGQFRIIVESFNG